MNSNTLCPISLESMAQDAMALEPCHHHFSKPALQMLLGQPQIDLDTSNFAQGLIQQRLIDNNISCPLCREKVTAIRVDTEYRQLLQHIEGVSQNCLQIDSELRQLEQCIQQRSQNSRQANKIPAIPAVQPAPSKAPVAQSQVPQASQPQPAAASHINVDREQRRCYHIASSNAECCTVSTNALCTNQVARKALTHLGYSAITSTLCLLGGTVAVIMHSPQFITCCFGAAGVTALSTFTYYGCVECCCGEDGCCCK